MINVLFANATVPISPRPKTLTRLGFPTAPCAANCRFMGYVILRKAEQRDGLSGQGNDRTKLIFSGRYICITFQRTALRSFHSWLYRPAGGFWSLPIMRMFGPITAS